MSVLVGCLFAAFEFTMAGGPSSAVLTTAAVVSLDNCIFVNPAMLVLLEGYSGSFLYANPYTVAGLHYNQIAFNLKKPINFGFGLAGLGMKGYQELTFSVAAAFPVGQSLCYGAALQGLYLGIDGYGADLVPALDLGLCWQKESYALGLAIDNLNQPRNKSGDELPAAITLGTAIKPVKSLVVSADFVKEKRYGEGLRAGAEFQLVRGCALRLGLGMNPFVVAAGAGVRYKSLRLDYGLRFHPRLKETHAIGLGVTWK